MSIELTPRPVLILLQVRALSGKESPKKSRLVEPEEIQAGKTFAELLETDITSSEDLRVASQ